MDTIVVEQLQKKIVLEINEVLKQHSLEVDKMQFLFTDKPSLVINLKTTST